MTDPKTEVIQDVADNLAKALELEVTFSRRDCWDAFPIAWFEIFIDKTSRAVLEWPDALYYLRGMLDGIKIMEEAT